MSRTVRRAIEQLEAEQPDAPEPEPPVWIAYAHPMTGEEQALVLDEPEETLLLAAGFRGRVDVNDPALRALVGTVSQFFDGLARIGAPKIPEPPAEPEPSPSNVLPFDPETWTI